MTAKLVEPQFDTTRVSIVVLPKSVVETPRYDLDDEEVERLTRELLAEQPLSDCPKSYGLYVLDGGNRFANLGRTVEASVFLEKFGQTADELQLEYDPYEDTSSFVLVVDQVGLEGRQPGPAGVMRIIADGPAGQKSLIDIEERWGLETLRALEAQINLPTTWDVATMAVHPSYRGGQGVKLVNMGLYYGIYNLSLRQGVTHWVGILTDEVLRYLNRVGFDMRPAGDSREYLGWPNNTPFVTHVAALRSGLAKSKRSFFIRMLGEGEVLREAYDFTPELEPRV